jgi:hypothetical protein
LKPLPRIKQSPPSIGPFEISTNTVSNDFVEEMILSVKDNICDEAWELPYAKCRQEVPRWLDRGDHKRALANAKAQFILCPMDKSALDAAILSVREVLLARDGNEKNGTMFEQYARYGPNGEDGVPGTKDDAQNPMRDVSAVFFDAGDAFYRLLDDTLERRASVSATWEKQWYDTDKAFFRLSGGRIEEGAEILAGTLADTYQMLSGISDVRRRHDNILRRIRAGFSVVYRARFGTVAGFDSFADAVEEYGRYGILGRDGRISTEDDLEPPM